MHGAMGKRLALGTVLAACLLAFLSGPASAATLTHRDAVEKALVERMNDVRRNHGLQPLRGVPPLTKAATRHAASMGTADYFRHELFTPSRPVDWTAFGTWIRWFYPGPGYTSWSAGENLAWGAPDLTARQAVRRWLDSPGHRANLLNPSWRNVGVSVVHVHNPAGYYSSWNDVTIVAAEFGRRS
jgi:uncharacterized protein YkwD